MSKAWMPFYGGDFVGNTLHLSATEIGAYVLILWHCWEHGGVAPAENAALCRIARVHPPHWPRIRNALEPLFDITKTPGSWYSKRVGLELTKNGEITNKRKAAAEQMLSKRRANAQQVHTQSQSQTNTKSVIVNTQSIAAGSRSGSNGPARPASGNAQIGERMGKYFWNGQAWIDQPETDQCPF
jgi:uncharacterized protein YdaU (DUF1376 family)